jgi:glutathione S-transferase
MTQRYVVYGNELSYFTRKLEAALSFYGASFEMRTKDPAVAAVLESRSGTHQVPVLQTPENWMIADTTPLLDLLDGRFPFRRLFPPGPLGVLCHVVEEYFDEWVARTMVHYRWHYPESAEFASLRMARGQSEVAARVRSWGPRACRATGTDSPHQQRAAEAEYVRILDAIDAQLGVTRYLLGDRPTAVDCIVLGGLRAHTNMDPDPRKTTAAYPRILAWSDGGADTWDGSGELAPFPESTAFARFVLAEMVGTYRPFVLGNAAAQLAGAKAFHVETYGEDVSYLSRSYPEQSRGLIKDRITRRLTPAERRSTLEWLDATGLRDCFGVSEDEPA